MTGCFSGSLKFCSPIFVCYIKNNHEETLKVNSKVSEIFPLKKISTICLFLHERIQKYFLVVLNQLKLQGEQEIKISAFKVLPRLFLFSPSEIINKKCLPLTLVIAQKNLPTSKILIEILLWLHVPLMTTWKEIKLHLY